MNESVVQTSEISDRSVRVQVQVQVQERSEVERYHVGAN